MGVRHPLAWRLGPTVVWLAAMTLAAGMSACSDPATGLHVNVHLGALSFDELRFGVVAAGVDGGDAMTLVAPDTLGRRPGPFPAGDPDVVILLRDDIDGRAIVCDVTALRAGLAVGTGHNAMLGQAHHIRDMDVLIDATSAGDAGAGADADTDAAPGGDGGSADARDAVTDVVTSDGGSDGPIDRGASDGGSDGRDGATGPDGGGADSRGADGGNPGTGANGVRCSAAAACASLHCVDGVCCESACGAACSSCALAKQEGRCRAVAARAPDPHGLCVDTGAAGCGSNGLCDGAGACSRYPLGTTCTPSCADAQNRFAAGLCTGAGACAGVGRVACPAPARSCVAGSCL